MTRIAHVSDLHFGRVNDAVIQALMADIKAVAPDLVVASGDFTQSGRRREFRRARAFLDRLPAPVFAVPGNHDMPYVNLAERMLLPFHRYRRHIAETIEPDLTFGPIALVGLNSARPFGWHWNWAHGRLSRRQIRRLEGRFGGATKAALRVVVAHHPFLPPPDRPRARLIGRAREALALMSGLGVDLILGGHLHLGYVGTTTLAPPGRHRAMVIAQAATTTSSRLRGQPNAYNLIDVQAGRPGDVRLSIEVRPFDGAAFTPGGTLRFHRSDDGWRQLGEGDGAR